MLICLRGPLFCHLNTKWKNKEIQRQFWREWFKSFLNQLGRKDLFFDHKTRRFRRVSAPWCSKLWERTHYFGACESTRKTASNTPSKALIIAYTVMLSSCCNNGSKEIAMLTKAMKNAHCTDQSRQAFFQFSINFIIRS